MDARRTFAAVRVTIVAAVCAVLALMPLGQWSVSAYQGDQQMWGMQNLREESVIVVSRLDVGDVNLNTEFVNQVDAKFVRENLGSDYRKVRFAGYEDPEPGTTVMRRFTFTTSDGYDGTLIVTDEWGPNIWMFILVNEGVTKSELRTFVSATVQQRYPSEIPAGYGAPRELDV
ncbi:MAG: hypothetical protein QM589_14625 [Thermomicrobiales bacterium]